MFDRELSRKLDRTIVAEGLLSGEPYRMVEELSELGSRFGGTDSERRAVAYLMAKMKELGLENVHKEEFTYTGWLRGSASLECTYPIRQDFPVIGLPHTGTYEVEGPLHYVGLGTPAEWESQAAEIAGKIVIVDAKSPTWIRRGIHRLEKYGRATAAGAIGFIWMRDQGGFLPETGSMPVGAPIPAVGISREHGMALIRLARQAAGGQGRVRIALENTVKTMPSWNVVGEIPGEGRPDRTVIIGAHFDGHDIAPGSLDDASGTAVTLEAGRLLAQHGGKLARTVRLICFAAEEIGLIGSSRYVTAHQAELDGIDFMLNLDGAGRGGERGIMLQTWPELLPVFKAISTDMRWPLAVDTVFGMHSDMYPFSLQGVPSGDLSYVGEVRTGRNWGHTSADTLDKASDYDLRMDSTLVARVMARVANWDAWPARRKTPEEMLQIIRDAGLYEAFKYGAFETDT
jgi:Zn-dependent M28 family amino/carboxypeptidase